jgi:hypothetical protein
MTECLHGPGFKCSKCLKRYYIRSWDEDDCSFIYGDYDTLEEAKQSLIELRENIENRDYFADDYSFAGWIVDNLTGEEVKDENQSND